MIDHLALQSDFEKPETLENLPNVLFFSKKSPFKDTCNEDAVGVFGLKNGFVLAVADGAGGHPKGEEAAELILRNIKHAISGAKETKNGLRSELIDAIEKTNKELIANGNGARTTVSVCEIYGNIARGYQVGDSTLVICGQKGKLKHRSTSHSPVGYGIEAGLIDEKEALDHPDLHYISNLVGESAMKIEIGPEIELSQNDTVFLASDGIFDNFPPDEIIELVRKGGISDISIDLMNLINKKIYDKEDTKKDRHQFYPLQKLNDII